MTIGVKRKTEYHVKDFMYGLGIKNSDLKVYAALYSFTVGEMGLYHGSAAYLADSLGISLRTVRRAYAKLSSLGLIERQATSDGRYVGLCCVMSFCQEKKADKREIAEKSSSSEQKRDRVCEQIIERKTRDEEICELINERLVDYDAPDYEKNTFLMIKRYERSGDNRKFLSFGRSGGVIMTEPQFKKLLEMLPAEELMSYFEKLEIMLDENVKSGRKPPHSHYKVIKKWIEEDTAV